MNADTSETGRKNRSLNRFRILASMALVAGPAGSAGLTVYAGYRVGSPPLLLGLFLIWVLSPFVMLCPALVVSRRWPARPRAALYGVTLAVAVASLAIYAYVALGLLRPRTAIFVVVPPASCLLIAIVVPAAAFVSRRSSR